MELMKNRAGMHGATASNRFFTGSSHPDPAGVRPGVTMCAMVARILVADDDRKQAELIRLYLEREGHDVLTVGNGRAALDQCRARRPDLVVLDVMMPLVDGLDVCR